ncbi:MAG: hypothetical protein ABDH31_01555 [Chlorobiota bacterium]
MARFLFLALLVFGGVAVPFAQAQLQVIIGNPNSSSYIYYTPYSQYCYGDYYVYPRKQYVALLYSGWFIQQAGGVPGLISRIEFQAHGDPWYGQGTLCQFTDRGQQFRVYMAISPQPNFPYTAVTYQQLISGAAPTSLQNIQLVFEGKAFTQTIPAGQWDGFTLNPGYVYTGGNLVVIIEFVNPCSQNCPTSYPDYLRGYGLWRSTYIYEATPSERNTRNTVLGLFYWYSYCYFGTEYDYTTSSAWPYDYYGRPNMRMTLLLGIEASFPNQGDILRAAWNYDGSAPERPRPSLTFRQATGHQLRLTYRIIGPLPSTNPVYIATDGGNPNDTILDITAGTTGLVTLPITSAKGPYAGPNGSLALASNNALGGTYRLQASYRNLTTGYVQEPIWEKEFVVAYNNDLAAEAITMPVPYRPPSYTQYPQGVNTPVEGVYKNVGLDEITAFRAIAEIRRASDNSVVYRDTVIWQQTPGLQTGQTATIRFKPFNTMGVGDYKLRLCGTLLNAQDQQAYNDCVPRAGAPEWIFRIQYDIELASVAVAYPTSGSVIYGGRPFRPIGVFQNNGLTDMSNVPVQLIITRLSDGQVVASQSAYVPDIPATFPNQVPYTFNAVTLPTGDYRATIIIYHPQDPVRLNDTAHAIFSVQGPLSGTYTIGTLFAGSPRNFNTIQDAINALYQRGVGGPVVFELTDAYYEVGDINASAPAIELRSAILGVNAQNTVTFRAYGQRALQRGSVTIRLKSGMGVGVMMEQSLQTGNPFAVVRDFPEPRYANFSGYIIFDGGQQKSLKIELDAPVGQPRRAVFYLGRGVHNVQVKNCLIGNAPTTSASYATSLPRVRYNVALGQFEWDPDVRIVGGQPVTYSAGVVIRNWRLSAYQGVDVLDTVLCSGNVIEGNEISGFGYGIVSLGLGPLKEAGPAKVRRYYNVGNRIVGNVITNVRGAGIVVGYEEGTEIRGNRIDNVGKEATGGSEPAAGIVAGGYGGYNNVGLVIEGNEVTRVSSEVMARGIVVEQVQNYLTGLEPQPVMMPDVPERTRVVNNVVWGIRRGAAGAHVGGIHLWTERDPAATGLSALLVPRRWTYWTRQDTVAHNTVWVQDDGVAGTGLVGGIVVQQAWGPVVVNNAVGVEVQQAQLRAAVIYEGLHPRRSGGVVQNWNAYWVSGGGDVVRMVEVLESEGQYGLRLGADGEYRTLSSWQAATGQDGQSVWGNWTGDYAVTGTVVQRLRVRTSPAPLGSILSNRGRAGVWSRDIDGEVRGAGGSRPDIGADEFQGREYQQDVEVVRIEEPWVWRASSGPTADAEYVMVRLPAGVKARVANRGTSDVVGWRVRLQVWREDGAGQFTVPVVDREVRVDLRVGEERVVDFGVQLPLQAYAEVSGYVVPARFAGMEQHVTPRYRLVVTGQPDQNGGNNVVGKEVRYYIERSPVMVTVDRGSAVGSRNADTLLAGVSRLGWRVDVGQGRYDYDVLNRAGWEARTVEYGRYRWVFWSGREGQVSEWERGALRQYLSSGQYGQKRNLVVSSQEVARSHVGMDPVNDEWFVRRVLRAQYVTPPGTPVSPNYDGRYVVGRTVGYGIRELVRGTGVSGDVPVPALLRVWSDAATEGLAQAAYVYESRGAGVVDTVAGVGTVALGWNVAYYGIEWRHWGQVDRVLRATIDFIRRNGGGVVEQEPQEPEVPVSGGGLWMRVRPTVAEEGVWVEYGGGRAGVVVEVYDGLGRRVWSGVGEGKEGQVWIGLAELGSGVYVVVVRDGQEVKVEQVRVVR